MKRCKREDFSCCPASEERNRLIIFWFIYCYLLIWFIIISIIYVITIYSAATLRTTIFVSLHLPCNTSLEYQLWYKMHLISFICNFFALRSSLETEVVVRSCHLARLFNALISALRRKERARIEERSLRSNDQGYTGASLTEVSLDVGCWLEAAPVMMFVCRFLINRRETTALHF